MFERISRTDNFCLNNVLIYRNKITQQDSVSLTGVITNAITASGAKQIGPTVTATHSIKMEAGQPVMDLEFIVPLDKEITVPSGFEFQPEFKIENALKMHVCGNPQELNSAMEELKNYVNTNGLTPVTPAYMATVKGAQTQEEMNDMIIDVYLGV